MKKVYISSCYFKHNYGSMLQAYATQKFLDLNNIDNETIDISTLADFSKGKKKYYKSQIFNINFYKAKLGMIKLLVRKKLNKKLKKNFSIRYKRFQKFQDDYFRLSENFNTYDELGEFCNNKASNVVVGSDQLWLPVNVVADYYTLNFVPDNVNKISYSTSFGVSSIPKKYEEKYKKFLSRLNHISTREETGNKIIKDICEIDSKVVCDPTLLLTRENWEEISSNKTIIDEKYIFCYFLGKNKNHRKFAEKLRKITGYKIVSINHCDEFVKYSEKYADYIPYDVGPSEWINLIKNAEYVCTDSFHGTVFSIIFNKQFFSFRRYAKKNKFSTNSRLDTLLKTSGIDNRIFTGEENEIDIKSIIADKINYELANKRIEDYRNESSEWFLSSLEMNGTTEEKGIRIDNKKNCCGCSACQNICPKNAITMTEDSEGFMYPKVDGNKCVGCNFCKKVCPILNREKEIEKSQYGYLIRNNDEKILAESTSGGAFSAFAEAIIENNGVVFGATFDENYDVHHIEVDNKESIYKFRNSKYVQSDLEDCFFKCKKYLNEGRMVLFSGTPCQIEGLIFYLGKEYDNLYLIDIVCHSVPSRLIWRKYKEMRLLKNPDLRPVAFRDKTKYGYEYSQMRFDDSKKIYTGVESDQYLRAFFKDLSVRPSCYNCKFKKRYRKSDLTIWDCFTIHKFDKSLDDNKGVTRCVTHSNKGLEMISMIEEKCFLKKIDVELLISDAKEMQFSVKEKYERKAFFEDANLMDSKSFFNKWFPINFKVKIKKAIRNILEKLGIYRPVKRCIKKIIGK